MRLLHQHLHLLLPLQNLLNILIHHALQVLQLLDQLILLILVLVAIEEGLNSLTVTNCCLYISAKVAFISKALAVAISAGVNFSLNFFLISSRKTTAVLVLSELSARQT